MVRGRADPRLEVPPVGRLTVGRLLPAAGRDTDPPVEGRALVLVRGALLLPLGRAEVRLDDPPTARATEPRPRAMRSIRLPLELPEAEDPLLFEPPNRVLMR